MTNISEFSTDQVFRSLQDLKDWVQDLVRSQGYVIVTKRSRAITFGKTSKVELCCDRGGIARNKDAETKKINCPFKLIGKYLKAHDGWKLRVVCDEHNHEPSMYMEGHSFAMRLTEKETRLVHDLTDLNVRPLNILSTIKEQNPNNVSSLTTIYNCRHRYKISQRDGNCGFRSIAACLGYGEDEWLYVRRQLLDEILSSYDGYTRVFYGIEEIITSLSCSKSPAPTEHWMVMPDTGILIANRFGVIVNYLTIRGSTTCFPLWKGPDEFSEHQIITIAHVYDNHYVMVQLEEDYPMPPISGLWIRHKAPSAVAWQTMYASRLEIYKQFNPTRKSFINLED